VAGRVLAIASFHSEALFTSFARQTDEPENSSERETLRFRVRRPKRRKCDVCAFFFSHLPSGFVRGDCGRYYYGARSPIVRTASIFVSFPHRVFTRAPLFQHLFLACMAVAQWKCCLYVLFAIVLNLIRKERGGGESERERKLVSDWKDGIINTEKNHSMNVKDDSLKVIHQNSDRKLCKLFSISEFCKIFFKCEESRLCYSSEIIKRDLMQILKP